MIEKVRFSVSFFINFYLNPVVDEKAHIDLYAQVEGLTSLKAMYESGRDQEFIFLSLCTIRFNGHEYS